MIKMDLITATDIATGTYYKSVSVDNLKNFIFQYKLTAGKDNTVEIQFWATVYSDANESTDDDWLNITTLFTGLEKIMATDETIHDMSINDSNLTFAKIKIKYIVTESGPSNSLKIGLHSDQ